MAYGCYTKISQMPVVLIPVHFDRDPALKIPSCSRSVVIRPFLTSDFMTGVPAVPGSQSLPLAVSKHFLRYSLAQVQAQVKATSLDNLSFFRECFLSSR